MNLSTLNLQYANGNGYGSNANLPTYDGADRQEKGTTSSKLIYSVSFHFIQIIQIYMMLKYGYYVFLHFLIKRI